MKFTFLSSIKGHLILLFAVFCVTNLYAQDINQNINTTVKEQTIKTIIEQVQQQSPFRFVYNKSTIGDKSLSLSKSILTLDEILSELALKAKLKFERSGNQIMITPAELGTVSGSIRTKDNQPDAFVTVRIKGFQSTSTDEDGNYSFKNVPAGNYIIGISHVGRSSLNRQIHVKANETTTVSFVLSASSTDLEEVLVIANKTNKFSEKQSDYVAKMPLKNLENPQVYTTISNRLIKEQLTVNVLQALANVPGAVPSTSPAGGIDITLRGFSAGLGARNGIQYVAAGRSSVDPINIERIEVLKGPSATLFGNVISSYGGAVNLVTKKPFATAVSEISYSMGSWGLSRATADVNAPVNEEKTALLRVNAAVNKQGSFLQTGHNNTLAIVPSFSYQASKKLFLSLDVEATREDVTRPGYINFDVLNLTNVNQIPLDYRQSLFADDFNATTNTFRTYFEARYQWNKNWASYTNLSVINERLEKSYQNESSFISADSIRRAMRVFGPFNTSNTNIQHNLKGDFKIGSVRNRLIWGVDYTQEKQSRYTARGVADVISIKDPIYQLTRPEADKVLGSAYPYTFDVNRYATYLSNLVNFTDRLMALVSLRVDRYERSTSDGGSEDYKQTSVTPKFGLIYQPVKDQISVFANYMSGFTNIAPATQPDGTILKLKPEYGVQWEGGVKLNTADNKWSATLSYYNIDVKDAVRTDASQYTFQDGKQKSKGFDVSVTANPIPGLNLIAGYAFNENKYTVTETLVGKEVVGNPGNVANFWVSYKLQPQSPLSNLGFGFGGNYVDKGYFDSENTIIIPSYLLLNATLFYDQQKWRFGLACNNLANKKYWSYQNPQPLRQLILSTSFRF